MHIALGPGRAANKPLMPDANRSTPVMIQILEIDVNPAGLEQEISSGSGLVRFQPGTVANTTERHSGIFSARAKPNECNHQGSETGKQIRAVTRTGLKTGWFLGGLDPDRCPFRQVPQLWTQL